jgi:hypothetical protein
VGCLESDDGIYGVVARRSGDKLDPECALLQRVGENAAVCGFDSGCAGKDTGEERLVRDKELLL